LVTTFQPDTPPLFNRPNTRFSYNSELTGVLRALINQPRTLNRRLEQTLFYLANNATRAKPERDKLSGRLKLGIEHVHASA
jgi:hypothetical protein